MSARSDTGTLAGYFRRVLAGLFPKFCIVGAEGDVGGPGLSDLTWWQAYEQKLALGHAAEGEEILLARIGSAPADFEAVKLLCRHYQERGKLQLAENPVRQYLNQSPGHIGAQTLLARICWQSGRTDEALAQMHESLRLKPRSGVLWKTLIRRYSQSGRYDEAIATARKWLDAMPGSGPAHFQMANLLVKEGLDESALKHLEHATRDPEVAIDAGLVIARTRLRMKELDSALAQTYLCLAESARFLPRHLDLVLGLAQQFHSWGQFQAVADCCEAARAGNSDDPLCLAIYVQALRQLGRMAEAGHCSAQFSGIVRRRRDVDPVRYAHALWVLERFDEALTELRESLRMRPDSDKNWRLLVGWLDRLERGEDSLDAARRWVAAMPGSGQANWQLARLLVGEGHYESAREYSEKALATATVEPEPGFEIVRTYLRRNEIKLAAELMERLVAAPEQIGPRNSESIMKLARVFHAQRQYPVAETCCRSVARFCGNDPAFLALHGHILLSRGEIDRARELLERSVRIAPMSEKAPRLLLALSYIHHGDVALGRAYLAEATGFQEEGKILAELFGGAAPLIPYFGAEIDRSLASNESS